MIHDEVNDLLFKDNLIVSNQYQADVGTGSDAGVRYQRVFSLWTLNQGLFYIEECW